MTRSFGGLVFLAGLVAFPAFAAAQSAPQLKASRQKEQMTISLLSGQLRVVETLSRSAVDLQIVQGTDVVRFTGDLAGQVTVQRGAARQTLTVRSAAVKEQTAIAAMLAGSAALSGFDTVMETSWGRSSRPAAPFRSARALLALFRGDYAPTARLIASMASPAVSLVRRGPNDCWESYSHDVVQYTYDLEACVAEARDSWVPWALGWCAYEYDLKTSLAFWWLLDCYGLP